jgi:hypothetical protein
MGRDSSELANLYLRDTPVIQARLQAGHMDSVDKHVSLTPSDAVSHHDVGRPSLPSLFRKCAVIKTSKRMQQTQMYMCSLDGSYTTG